jgi:biopolymer transport protein TolR
MQSKRSRKGFIAEINVVPYIDVMLVLLVIFMITTPLLSQGVKVDLPKARAQALSSKQNEPIIVSVDASGNYYLNLMHNAGQPVSAVELQNRVSEALNQAKQNQQQRAVYVKGDQHVDYGKIVQAMVLLQQAGAGSVGLMTETPSKLTE